MAILPLREKEKSASVLFKLTGEAIQKPTRKTIYHHELEKYIWDKTNPQR